MMTKRKFRAARMGLTTLLMAGTAAGSAVAVPAAAGAAPVGSGGYAVHVFATGTTNRFGPDDIVRLGRDVFVAWQNGVGSTGSPSSTGNKKSTIVEYRTDGTTVHEWQLTGKIDGMGADPVDRRIIATVNEDGNSSLYVVDPSAEPGNEVHHYTYRPSGTLPHGGGTDSVTVVGGRIFIAASAPTSASGPALYRATLSDGIATLQPVFFDNSQATVANTNGADHGHSVALALTDPDSTTRVPMSAPRFRGDLVLDSQGDEQQIYVSDPGSNAPSLSLLRLTQSVDDTAFATSSEGTLYVTDGTDNELFTVTGRFDPGTAFTSVTPSNANNPVNAPNYLGRINLATGNVTPVITTIQAKGLLFF